MHHPGQHAAAPRARQAAWLSPLALKNQGQAGWHLPPSYSPSCNPFAPGMCTVVSTLAQAHSRQMGDEHAPGAGESVAAPLHRCRLRCCTCFPTYCALTGANPTPRLTFHSATCSSAVLCCAVSCYVRQSGGSQLCRFSGSSLSQPHQKTAQGRLTAQVSSPALGLGARSPPFLKRDSREGRPLGGFQVVSQGVSRPFAGEKIGKASPQ